MPYRQIKYNIHYKIFTNTKNDRKTPTIGRCRHVIPRPTLVKGRIPWALQYRHGNWLRLKAAILRRDGRQCRRRWTKARALHVHHRRYGRGYIWDVPGAWLVTLCDRCHNWTHGLGRSILWASWILINGGVKYLIGLVPLSQGQTVLDTLSTHGRRAI
jgi:hypothetical protein